MSLGSGTSQSESHRSTRRAPVCLRRFVMLLYRTESALFASSLLLTFIGGLFLLYPYEPNRRGWLPSLQKTTNETSDQESEAMSCRLAIADLGNPRHFHWFSRRTIDSLTWQTLIGDFLIIRCSQTVEKARICVWLLWTDWSIQLLFDDPPPSPGPSTLFSRLTDLTSKELVEDRYKSSESMEDGFSPKVEGTTIAQ